MATSTAKKPTSPKTAAKPAGAPKKAAIGAPKVTPPEVAGMEAAASAPEVGQGDAAKVIVPLLRKKDLVARVVEALDGKKKGAVKDIVEATLATLGEALQKGEALNLPPFGKARVAKQKGEGAESMLTIRLRGAGEKIAPRAPKEALAEVSDND
jgi:nucleoid DNA-binding protein